MADLLNSGATVSTNILIIAIKSEYFDMIKLLLRHVIRGSDSYTDTLIVCLMFTVKNSDISVVRYFIDAGAPLNPTPDWPLLQYTELVKKGYSDDFMHSYSPLREACKRGNVDIVRLLLDNGATPNLDIDRELPIYAAVRFRHIRVVELLLSRGVDVNAVKHGLCDEATALSYACTDDQVDMVKLLLHHGAKIDIDDPSALVGAAKKRHQAVVELLLHHGAHVKFEDPHAHVMFRRYRLDGEVWVDRSAVPANSQSILDDRGVIMAVALCRFYYGRSRSAVYERDIIDGRVLVSICLCAELESVTTEWMRLYHYYQSN